MQQKESIKQETINAKLDYMDVINMIRGTYPPYKLMDELTKLGFGSYCSGFHDKWYWTYASSEAWRKLTLTQLFSLYLILKK